MHIQKIKYTFLFYLFVFFLVALIYFVVITSTWFASVNELVTLATCYLIFVEIVVG